MKTIKKNKTVELLLEKARIHVQLATVDLDFADMAIEEISVLLRIATVKKGYTVKDALDEIYEYTGMNNQNPVVVDYLSTVSEFKWAYKHTVSIK